MAEYIRIATLLMGVVGVLVDVTLLIMQLYTYRRTRHPSLLILAGGGIAGMLYIAFALIASTQEVDRKLLGELYLLMVVMFIVQAVLGIWGAAGLFREFRRRHSPPAAEGDCATLRSQMAHAGPERRAVRARHALICLFRLWTLRRAPEAAALAGERSIGGLALISLALWLSIDRLRAGPTVMFAPFGLEALGLIVLLLLALAFLISRPARPALPYRQALFILAAGLPLAIVLDTLIQDRLSPPWDTIATAVLLTYSLVYLWRALRSFTGTRQPWSILLSAAMLGVYLWLDQTVYLRPSLFMAAEPEVEADPIAAPAARENLLFGQQHRIDEDLSAIDGTNASKPSVFYVGFAGVGSQKVFAEEIKLAARVVGGRYDSAHRELLLLNDRRDRDQYPIASVTNLGYALKGIAGRMDPQRDILFLSLSSHGSQEPELAVSNGSLSLAQLNDANLSQALRESGIRWRIIVISACHAGAFIHALQDPDTIVITASAADRTSFGCANDRDLTYFGEAFYRDALPKAKTLKEAFAMATAAIAKREAAEHIQPSEPQAYFGADLVRMLSQQHLEGTTQALP